MSYSLSVAAEFKSALASLSFWLQEETLDEIEFVLQNLSSCEREIPTESPFTISREPLTERCTTCFSPYALTDADNTSTY